VEKEEHKGLRVEADDEAGVKRVSTDGAFMDGNWNTVLGDKELPAKGRHYWEVKIARKPNEAVEYIGLAEATVAAAEPLLKQKNGKAWCLGGSLTETMFYQWLECTPDMSATSKKFSYLPGYRVEDHAKMVEMIAGEGLGLGMHFSATRGVVPRVDKAGKKTTNKGRSGRREVAIQGKFTEKDIVNLQKSMDSGKRWTGGTHIGLMTDVPPFLKGTVVGVDVDMDAGTLGFWANGKFVGLARDSAGKPVNIKGKKLFPAVSVYGRHTGGSNEFSTFEVKTGLAPPERPSGNAWL